MEVNSKLVESVILSDVERQKPVRVTLVSASPLVGPGENFSSEMARLKVTVDLASGHSRQISIILKRRLRAESIDLNHSFDTEILLFENFLPELECFLVKTKHADGDTLWGKFYGGDKNNIFLEDLNELGYRMADRSLPLDEDHMLLAVRALARIHAASKPAINSNKIDCQLLGRNFFFAEGALLDGILKNLWSKILSHVRSNHPQWIELAEIVANTKSHTLKFAEIRRNDPEWLKVLNHGDAWRNNYMFKYEDNKPTSIKLVDFQMSHYSSLGWDLAYALHSSVPIALWEDVIPRLLEAYCHELARSTEALSPGARLLSTTQLRAELSRLSRYSFSMAPLLCSLVLNTSSEEFKLDDLTGDNSDQVFTNPTFLRQIPYMFSYFRKEGLAIDC